MKKNKTSFSKGLEGVIATKTSISHVDGEKGKLIYRGYSIEDLAKHACFEEVIYLLWFGKLPTRSKLDNFKKALLEHMKIQSKLKLFITSLPKKNTAISSLRTCVSLLAAYDSDADNISVAASQRKAPHIMGVMPALIAAIYRSTQHKPILSPKQELSFAGNFLYLLQGNIPDKKTEKIMDVCLILHADHGMNASTFSSRVTVATLSDIYSGIVSAISTLKGPLHGGANEKAIQFLHHLVDELYVGLDDVDQYIKRLLKAHKRIMGIGHRVYKVKDPRAKILEHYAANVSQSKQKYFQIAKKIEHVMTQEKKLYPNADFFSGLVLEDISIPSNLYVCIFALSRTSGWLAHILEQYQDNRLIRPRALYIGKLRRKYIPLAKRKN